MMIDPLDVGLVNCADCRRELVGPKTARRLDQGHSCPEYDRSPRVAGWVAGRPYCFACIEMPDYPIRGGSYGPHDEPSPGFENAVKAMEDGA